ncbi:MAG: hypothetical protein QNL77_00690 [Akkermansiaceae bacterium]
MALLINRKIYRAMTSLSKIVLALSSATLLTSCGYDYKSETVELSKGQSYRGRTLEKVRPDGISLSKIFEGKKYTTDFQKINPKRSDNSYSLGNNQHLRIISLSPSSQSAELEFSWLDSVGFFTHPPF